MGDGYDLVKYQLDERHVFWELKKSSHSQSELQKAMADRRWGSPVTSSLNRWGK